MTDAEEIYVLDKRLKLLQVPDGFRTSMDSVFLAAACKAKGGDHILDMGCGVGGAGLAVLRRVEGARLTGVDIQEDHVELAQKNVGLNEMGGAAEFVCSDIRAFKPETSFDHVICNPPYLEAGAHTMSPSEKKARALGHLEEDISTQTWLDLGFRFLKSRGTLSIIHRADQIDKIMLGLKSRFGNIETIPLWPRDGQDAKRVIVRAVKDRNGPAQIRAGIVLHEEDGSYTARADDILRGMQAID